MIPGIILPTTDGIIILLFIHRITWGTIRTITDILITDTDTEVIMQYGKIPYTATGGRWLPAGVWGPPPPAAPWPEPFLPEGPAVRL